MRAGTRPLVLVTALLAAAGRSCDSAHVPDAGPRVAEQEKRVGSASEALITAPLTVLDRTDLCVTLGTLTATATGHLHVDQPKMRAVASAMTLPVAELRFVYLGPTPETVPLRSGIVRRQLGLKLRAQDGCNVVYVMWHIEPSPDLVVSIKRNPGLTRSAQCGVAGYQTIRPSIAAKAPPLAPGARHVLRAEMRGDTLDVTIDGLPAWLGALPPEVMSFDGPVGVRTDNAQMDFDLATISTGAPAPPAKCQALQGPE